MIRICLAAAAALVVSACSSQPDDVTATYSVGNAASAMVVKAAGNGDGRVDSDGQTLIRRGGTEYLIGKDSQGEFAVSLPDFEAAMDEVFRESGGKAEPMPGMPEFDLGKAGTEKIAGIDGEVWTLKPKGKDAPPGAEADAVISTDPALAPAGAVMAMQTRLTTAAMTRIQGETSFAKRVTELLDKGLVLRFGPALKLAKLEKGPIDAAAFELPKTVLNKDQLKARATAERDRIRKAMPAAPAGEAAPAAPAAPAKP